MNVSSVAEDLILTEGYERFCRKRRFYYRNLTNTYSAWYKFSCIMSVVSILLYELSGNNIFFLLFKGFLIMFIMSVCVASAARNAWAFYIDLSRDYKAELIRLDISDCKIRGKELVFYQGKKYQRLDLIANEKDITPGFWMVSATTYRFIVEVFSEEDRERIGRRGEYLCQHHLLQSNSSLKMTRYANDLFRCYLNLQLERKNLIPQVNTKKVRKN